MRSLRRPMAAALALALASAVAAGCTISNNQNQAEVGAGSIKKIDALAGKQLKVGSKEFDEQLLLGQIAILALQATGAKPVDKTNITGSTNVRKALTTGEIDLYWEYTGTAWITYLGQTQAIPDAQKQYDAVKSADAKNNVTWWAPSPANDTYAMVVNPVAQKQNKVHTLSQYAALVKSDPAAASTCVGPEFKSRDDGFPGLQKKYGFSLPAAQTHVLTDSVVYDSVGTGKTCAFGSVAATDGRVSGKNLVLLDDDKKFFPIYNPAISVRTSVAKQYPQLEAVFAAIASKLDTSTLTNLNKKVSVDGEKPAKVAHDWLKSAGFIS